MEGVELRVLSSISCARCRDFEELWSRCRVSYPHIRARTIDVLSEEGQHLLVRYRIFRLPGLVLDERLVALGDVDEDALRRSLDAILP